MKKLLIISLFIISALSFADNNPYDYVEDKLQLKYVELTDGKNKLDIDDIDVGSFNNKIYVNMEVEAFSGDGGWSKFDKAAYDKAMENAVKIHNVIGLKGISRSDFMLKDGEVYFLEVNTCPGMTKTSLIPDLGTLKGYTFDDLVKIMVDTFKK